MADDLIKERLSKKRRNVFGVASAQQDDARELDHRATNVEHTRLFSIFCKVPPQVNEDPVDCKASIDLFSLSGLGGVRHLVTIRHRRELHIKFANLVLIHSEHVLCDSGNGVLQGGGRVLHTRPPGSR